MAGSIATAPSFADETLAVQGGVDLYRGREAGTRDFVGLTFAYGHTNGNVENFDRTIAGNDRFDANSLGGLTMFHSDAKTLFSSDAGFLPFHSDLSGAWGEGGLGSAVQLDDALSIYAAASYQRGFNGGVRDIGGTIGLRLNPG